MPEVSVIMSVFNGEKYLPLSIESILSQTFKDFEFIIIDDGSTDRSAKVLSEYARRDARLKVVSQKNIGLTKSLNKAIHLSSGRFIARQDVDDISLLYRLEKQIDLFKKQPSLDLVVCWYYVMDDKDNIIAEKKIPESKILKRYLPRSNLIAHASVMFKKSTFDNLGGYDEGYKYGQDWALWKKMDNIGVIPESLIKYRVSFSNISHKKFQERIKIKDPAKFVHDRQVRIISGLLLEWGDPRETRKYLKNELYSLRNICYYLFTFLPAPVLKFLLWEARFFFKQMLGMVFGYYKNQDKRK